MRSPFCAHCDAIFEVTTIANPLCCSRRSLPSYASKARSHVSFLPPASSILPSIILNGPHLADIFCDTVITMPGGMPGPARAVGGYDGPNDRYDNPRPTIITNRRMEVPQAAYKLDGGVSLYFSCSNPFLEWL